MRPPPESSAYGGANPLYDGVLDRLAGHGNATARSSSRAPRASARARSIAPPAANPSSFPEHAIDAQSLIAFADLVVSAGGTMNREAVALGTPVYTIFGGRMGAVDEQLIAEGMLRPLGDPGDLDAGEAPSAGRGAEPARPVDPRRGSAGGRQIGTMPPQASIEG